MSLSNVRPISSCDLSGGIIDGMMFTQYGQQESGARVNMKSEKWSRIPLYKHDNGKELIEIYH